MDYWAILVLLFSLTDWRRVRGLLLVTDIAVPPIVDFRDNVTLSCSYDISGHTLNSVKWYKDDMEFFRYSPLTQPVYMKFPVAGVQLTPHVRQLNCNESTCRVQLNPLGIRSSGVYRCEVSGDAPHFKLAERTANMTVEALPQNNPEISNFNTTYRHDDFVQVNCTSGFASLPVKLSWYINDIQATAGTLQPAIETKIAAHEYNLYRQSRPLSFYASDSQYRQDFGGAMGIPAGSVLKLRCVAEIENFPELRRAAELYAILIPDELLRNQKLVNSGAAGASHLRSLTTLSVLLVLLIHLRCRLSIAEEVVAVSCTQQIQRIRDCYAVSRSAQSAAFDEAVCNVKGAQEIRASYRSPSLNACLSVRR